MLFKLIMAIVTGAAAIWTWRRAKQWQDAGEIPASQDEFGRITKSDNLTFKPYIIWTMLIAGGFAAFFLLCVGSMSVDLVRYLRM